MLISLAPGLGYVRPKEHAANSAAILLQEPNSLANLPSSLRFPESSHVSFIHIVRVFELKLTGIGGSVCLPPLGLGITLNIKNILFIYRPHPNPKYVIYFGEIFRSLG